jgi:hypothetical protein
MVGDFSVDVMAKFISVLNGGSEIFTHSEYKGLKAILASLQVFFPSFPSWLFPRDTIDWYPTLSPGPKPKTAQLQLNPSTLSDFITSMPRAFRIRTKSHEYHCPIFALGLSPFIIICSRKWRIAV